MKWSLTIFFPFFSFRCLCSARYCSRRKGTPWLDGRMDHFLLGLVDCMVTICWNVHCQNLKRWVLHMYTMHHIISSSYSWLNMLEFPTKLQETNLLPATLSCFRINCYKNTYSRGISNSFAFILSKFIYYSLLQCIRMKFSLNNLSYINDITNPTTDLCLMVTFLKLWFFCTY